MDCMFLCVCRIGCEEALFNSASEALHSLAASTAAGQAAGCVSAAGD